MISRNSIQTAQSAPRRATPAAPFQPTCMASEGGYRAFGPYPRRDLADGQLVTLALNGDARAFPILMDRYQGKLQGLVLKRVRCTEEAADIVQSTLLSAWAALQSYPVSRPFEIWLVCIALNKCRDWGRRRTVRQRAAIYLPELSPQASSTAEETLIETQSADDLHNALERMPHALRCPLVLTAIEGLQQREVAVLLGLTPKAIETRVRRAKQWLRQELDRLGRPLDPAGP